MLKASQARLVSSLELLFTISNCEIVASSQIDNKIGLHHRADNQNSGEQEMQFMHHLFADKGQDSLKMLLCS